LGLAVHQALEVNFREKLETREDLETTGVVCVFREAWMEQVPQTVFTPDESQGDLRRLGERLVAKYMDEVAPQWNPPRSSSMCRVRSPVSRYGDAWTFWT
jgi:hypothetical protein